MLLDDGNGALQGGSTLSEIAWKASKTNKSEEEDRKTGGEKERTAEPTMEDRMLSRPSSFSSPSTHRFFSSSGTVIFHRHKSFQHTKGSECWKRRRTRREGKGCHRNAQRCRERQRLFNSDARKQHILLISTTQTSVPDTGQQMHRALATCGTMPIWRLVLAPSASPFSSTVPELASLCPDNPNDLYQYWESHSARGGSYLKGCVTNSSFHCLTAP